ncbi:hypothetical protein B0G77_8018 [Paraburkholderia sp. BL10I2N1]|nr:hypothetical protein B0G77_8018 [Paraburkholderia sp. BL10I2N1]
MSHISPVAVTRAMSAVKAMNLKQKEAVIDEIFLVQPHMLGSVLVLQTFGVSMEKMEFAFGLLLLCFQAMKESGLTWPLITEDEQELQLQLYTTTVKLGEDLGPPLRDRLMQQYIENHPEKNLLACVWSETANWLKSVVSEDSDKYVMMVAANLVNCIAFVPVPAQKKPSHRQRKSA